MKRAVFLVLSITSMAAAQIPADTSYWKHSLMTSLTVTQISYTDWAQGGENALSWTGRLEGTSAYDQGPYLWSSSYKFAYGTTKLGTQSMRKTDDNIDLSSSLTYRVGTYINPYVSVALKTQFAKGYTYDPTGVGTEISNFFDPAFLTQSAGLGYQPVPEVKVRLGAAVREIITNQFRRYADGEATKVEGGMESVIEVDTRVVDNIAFHSKLNLFSAFKTFDQVIVHSDNTLAAQINKYLSTTLSVQIIQERPISPRTQIKQMIALMASYVLI